MLSQPARDLRLQMGILRLAGARREKRRVRGLDSASPGFTNWLSCLLAERSLGVPVVHVVTTMHWRARGVGGAQRRPSPCTL